MAITFVDGKTATSASAVASLTVTKPTGTVNNDVLLLGVCQDGTGAITVSGFTQIGSDSAFTYFYRVANGEPASYTVTLTSTRRAGLILLAFRGVDTTTPVTNHVYQISTGSTAPVSLAIPGLASADYMLVAALENSRGSESFTVPTGYTLGGSFDTGAATEDDDSAAMAYKAVTAGTSAAATWGVTAAPVRQATAHFALATAATPPPPPDTTPGATVDWDEDGFSVGDHDDISANVASWVVRRGAGPRIVDSAQIGSLLLTVNNPQTGADADLFNPANTGGDLYGLLRDGKPIHVAVNSDGAWAGTDPRGLFGGRTTKIRPVPAPGARYAPQVEIEAEDGLGWYRRLPARISDSEGRSHAGLRAEMLEAAGETRYSLAHEILTMPLSSWDGDLLSGLEAINAANGTRHFCDPQDDREDWYLYTTRNRQWRLDGTVDASVNAGSDHATTSDWVVDADTVVNQQKASVAPVSFTPSATTIWEADGLPWVVTSAADRVVWIEFDDYVRDPALDLNYTGTAPTSTLTPFGKTAKLTISTSGTTTVTGLSIEGAMARRGVAVSFVIDDTASQTGSRGVRAGSEISGDFVGSEAAAYGIASHVVWRYGDVQYRPQLVVQNWIPEQFDVDLYDVMAITIAELGTTAMHFEVVGLEHRGYLAASASNCYHETTYYLQECRVQSDPGWFVLDTSELDDTPVLAY